LLSESRLDEPGNPSFRHTNHRVDLDRLFIVEADLSLVPWFQGIPTAGTGIVLHGSRLP